MTSRITFVDREQWYVIITFDLAWTLSARPPVPDMQLKSESWLSKLVVHSSIKVAVVDVRSLSLSLSLSASLSPLFLSASLRHSPSLPVTLILSPSPPLSLRIFPSIYVSLRLSPSLSVSLRLYVSMSVSLSLSLCLYVYFSLSLSLTLSPSLSLVVMQSAVRQSENKVCVNNDNIVRHW